MIVFLQPAWLLLALPLVALTVWLGRGSLSGLAGWSRRAALGLRVLVIAGVCAALADPQWRREAEAVSVTVVLDASRSLPSGVQGKTSAYMRDASRWAEPGDLSGLVTAAKDAYVQLLPGPVGAPLDLLTTGREDGTNLEEAVRLAMAVMRQNAANRLLLVSDGNETEGSLLTVAQAARAAGVPIDVLPQRFTIGREVIVDRLLAPATARLGETISLRAVLTATEAVRGRLTITLNGEAIDLDPDSPALGAVVELEPGVNVQQVPVRVPGTGPQRFEAVFEPEEASGDTLTQNNRALGVTFVGGQGAVLVMASRPAEAEPLMRVLAEAKISAELREPANAFSSMVDLGAFEGVVLVNTSAYELSVQQHDELKAYVHDLGGGLLMIGGPESFGAGGWIGSSLADALPIRLDPPQKRQMPRGALALIMHSCEMPQGNYWGRRTAEAAVDALTPQDMAGVLEAGWELGSAAWTHPLSVVGDKSAIKRSIRGMSYGDTQTFAEMMEMALASLQKAAAGQKHVIIISDADPSPPSDALLQQFVASKVSVSTVAVFPHDWSQASADLSRMKRIAAVTGGNYHEITRQDQLNSLPQIFIKEAQTIRRTLIWEGEPFRPALVGGQADSLRGIASVPPLAGYVVAADREGLSQVTLRGPENDPIMAQWQHGLGRAVTFTSDLGVRWARGWPGWDAYRAFWEQTLRWVMRPGGSPNISVITEDRGERTRVIVEALDERGDRLNFLRWQGRVVRPDLSSAGVELRQVGPGRYEAEVESGAAGIYTLSLGYDQTVTGADGQVGTKRGSVQAALTRPFADEFRALRDNAPLLEQVARETGGRVLTGDGRVDRVWSREGLKMPVSLEPMWLVVIAAAIGLLLADVGVRRVRIDVAGAWRRVRAAMGRGRTASSRPLDALKAARERAAGQIERAAGGAGRAGAGAGAGADDGGRASVGPAAAANRGVKFEASAEELAAARKAGAPGVIGAGERERGAAPAPVIERGAAAPGGGKTSGETGGEAGLSRLLKAKKRAQDDLKDE